MTDRRNKRQWPSFSIEELVKRFPDGGASSVSLSRSRTLQRKKGFWAGQKTPILC
jgi:hypothetical protein